VGCACQKGGRRLATYLWTSPADPEITVVYATEIQAKAKVIRDGGSYVRQP
jgi:hypothetical protein